MGFGVIDGASSPIIRGTDWTMDFYFPDGTQVVTISGATGGTFVASYIGQTTDPLPYNVTLDNFRSALETLVTIRPGNIALSGSVGAWVLTPQNQLDSGDFLDNPILIDGRELLPNDGSVSYNVSQPPLDLTGLSFGFQARVLVGTTNANDIVLTETDDPTQGVITNGGTLGTLDLTVYHGKTEDLDWITDADQRNTASAVLVAYDGTLTQPYAIGQLVVQPLIYQPGGAP